MSANNWKDRIKALFKQKADNGKGALKGGGRKFSFQDWFAHNPMTAVGIAGSVLAAFTLWVITVPPPPEPSLDPATLQTGKKFPVKRPSMRRQIWNSTSFVRSLIKRQDTPQQIAYEDPPPFEMPEIVDGGVGGGKRPLNKPLMQMLDSKSGGGAGGSSGAKFTLASSKSLKANPFLTREVPGLGQTSAVGERDRRRFSSTRRTGGPLGGGGAFNSLSGARAGKVGGQGSTFGSGGQQGRTDDPAGAKVEQRKEKKETPSDKIGSSGFTGSMGDGDEDGGGGGPTGPTGPGGDKDCGENKIYIDIPGIATGCATPEEAAKFELQKECVDAGNIFKEDQSCVTPKDFCAAEGQIYNPEIKKCELPPLTDADCEAQGLVLDPQLGECVRGSGTAGTPTQCNADSTGECICGEMLVADLKTCILQVGISCSEVAEGPCICGEMPVMDVSECAGAQQCAEGSTYVDDPLIVTTPGCASAEEMVVIEQIQECIAAEGAWSAETQTCALEGEQGTPEPTCAEGEVLTDKGCILESADPASGPTGDVFVSSPSGKINTDGILADENVKTCLKDGTKWVPEIGQCIKPESTDGTPIKSEQVFGVNARTGNFDDTAAETYKKTFTDPNLGEKIALDPLGAVENTFKWLGQSVVDIIAPSEDATNCHFLNLGSYGNNGECAEYDLKKSEEKQFAADGFSVFDKNKSYAAGSHMTLYINGAPFKCTIASAYKPGNAQPGCNFTEALDDGQKKSRMQEYAERDVNFSDDCRGTILTGKEDICAVAKLEAKSNDLFASLEEIEENKKKAAEIIKEKDYNCVHDNTFILGAFYDCEKRLLENERNFETDETKKKELDYTLKVKGLWECDEGGWYYNASKCAKMSADIRKKMGLDNAEENKNKKDEDAKTNNELRVEKDEDDSPLISQGKPHGNSSGKDDVPSPANDDKKEEKDCGWNPLCHIAKAFEPKEEKKVDLAQKWKVQEKASNNTDWTNMKIKPKCPGKRYESMWMGRNWQCVEMPNMDGVVDSQLTANEDSKKGGTTLSVNTGNNNKPDVSKIGGGNTYTTDEIGKIQAKLNCATGTQFIPTTTSIGGMCVKRSDYYEDTGRTYYPYQPVPDCLYGADQKIISKSPLIRLMICKKAGPGIAKEQLEQQQKKLNVIKTQNTLSYTDNVQKSPYSSNTPYKSNNSNKYNQDNVDNYSNPNYSDTKKNSGSSGNSGKKCYTLKKAGGGTTQYCP